THRELALVSRNWNRFRDKCANRLTRETLPPLQSVDQDRLSLTLRNIDDKTLKLVNYPDLTRQARCGTYIERKIEHVFFHRFRRTDDSRPRLIYVDMAGCAGAGPAALGFDAGNGVAD